MHCLECFFSHIDDHICGKNLLTKFYIIIKKETCFFKESVPRDLPKKKIIGDNPQKKI